jgi:hypothetical protein
MTALWKTTSASDVEEGSRVRLKSGEELTVTRIESPFLGRTEMLAFIEDTPARWYKRPVPATTDVEVQVID